MGKEKSEIAIVPQKSGNADGGKGYRKLDFALEETHSCTEMKKMCQRNSSE
jgi:hypothetical protein